MRSTLRTLSALRSSLRTRTSLGSALACGHLRPARNSASLAWTRAFYLLIVAGADSYDKEALRSHFIEEIDMAAGRVGAASVTPYEHGEKIALAELADILRTENSVRGQCSLLHHYGLVRAGAALFHNS